ncbi:expressed unknown protein [Seminavis robusta]|uniref:Uncharacterized protein n=1 Tax=Seminavis robusta TaxID=568900 RepID=A0A9N8HYV6_9STRA|nr:expressed unknown protein [Seminavis robusta]|eukprot:Sro2097_g314341.1  (537) ;mRNA; r:10967-12577
MLWILKLSEWFCAGARQGFSRAILLCVNAAILLWFWTGNLKYVPREDAIEPQKYALQIIDLNAENKKQRRQLVPISGYVPYGGNLVGETPFALFGLSVAMDETGATIVVREEGTGTIFVYENTSNGWTQKGQDLTGFPLWSFTFGSGHSVAISRDGSIVAVGSSATQDVVVFQYDTSTEMWLQRGSTIQGVELDGTPISASFGWAISMSGDGNKIAVGAPHHDSPTLRNIGFATTYLWNGNINDWERGLYEAGITVVSGLYGEIADAYLGSYVSLSGDGMLFAVGMPGSSASYSGSTRFGECRAFYNDGRVINQRFVNAGAMFGSTVNDDFGHSVALNYDGSIIAISSRRFDVGGTGRVGKVQVFERTDERWIQLGSDLIGGEQGDQFGHSIGLSNDGKTLVAGSGPLFPGRVPGSYTRIYKFDGTDWVLEEISRAQGFDIDVNGDYDRLGWSIAVSGDGTKVLVGAPLYDGSDRDNGLVQMWGQTDFPTFSPILNPLPQVGDLGTGGSPTQTNYVSRAFAWWQGAVAYLEGFLFK